MQRRTDWKIIKTKFADGERYAILLDQTGCPDWYATLYVTIHFRNASRSVNTAYAALSAVRQVLRWSQSRQIDLIERFQKRLFLQLHEIEHLSGFLKQRFVDDQEKGGATVAPIRRSESARAAAPKPKAGISSGFAYSRITYAAQYLQWLATRIITDAANSVDKATAVEIARMSTELKSRRALVRRKGGSKAKRAQSDIEQETLMSLSQPDHPDNPFVDATARRNLLIVVLLDELGIRAGELLAIKVSDIDFQSQKITIPRRHNDPEDPRHNQPVQKTLDRLLAISDELTLILTSYVLNDRRVYPEARRHPFLLVSTRASRFGKKGDPLSRQALTKIMSLLSEQMPAGSKTVHPHLFRHNAATRMFRSMRESGETEIAIARLLEWKFGWATGSGTARTYIESEVEREAMKAQRKLQEKWKFNERP